MIGSKITLVADVVTKIADSTKGVGTRSVYIESALTDVVLGGPAVAVATGCAVADLSPGISFDCGSDDLWAISHGGGVIYVQYPENC